MLENLFKTSCEKIEQAYLSLGHSIGWRFVTGPKLAFSKDTDLLFISLNPGGDHDPPEHPHESSENGSSYLIESWKGKPPGKEALQVQFQRLMAKLQQACKGNDDLNEFINSKVLTAHFIPFRSPRFKSLHNKEASIEFASTLWNPIIKAILPRVIITLNPETYKYVSKILTDAGGNLIEQKEFQTGWGIDTDRPIGSDVRKYKLKSRIISVLRLPHLSTFKLFSNDKCTPYLDEIFKYLCDGHYGK